MKNRIQPPLAYDGMTIGLLGGSFNPAHRGHRHISLIALTRLRLDRLWWLVSPGNPLKSHADLEPLENRMLRAAEFAQHPRIDVTDFEAARPSPYTIETLKFLKRRAPSANFIWIMGADNLANFHFWRDWRHIFALLPIAVIDRPQNRYLALASRTAYVFRENYIDEAQAAVLTVLKPPAWTFITAPLCSISSTEIRSRASSLC